MIVRYLWRDKKWNSIDSFFYIGGGYNLHNICNVTELEYINGSIGSFAAVKETDNQVILIVDLIASYPLFYRITNNTIIISDDASLIADNENPGLDLDNIKEFLKTGYVTEQGTIFQNIYTINPGTMLSIDKNTGDINIQNWFDLEYKMSINVDDQVLIDRFVRCLIDVFKDLIQRLNGRTAIVPLSGGCDSRLIVAYLKKLGYSDVLCFSYGRNSNWEAQRSKDIAKNLGFKWTFVEYNTDVWRDFLNSVDYQQYLDYSCRGRSIGCLQAVPAIINIRNKHNVSNNSVVIPGHAGDFSLGSHISPKLNTYTKDQLIKHIVSQHYILRDKQVELGSVDKWKNLICREDSLPINIYQQWEYRNRQSKFIANDVRAYEYAGYDYELPFWDIRVQNFVMDLSLDALLGRKFQYQFTKEKVDTIVGLNMDYSEKVFTRSIFKDMLKKCPGISEILQRRKMKDLRNNDTNAFLSWLNDEEFRHYKSLFGNNFNLNSIEADDYIRRIEKMYS